IGALGIDRVVFADTFGSEVTTPLFSTSVAGEALVAFVTAAQWTAGGTQATVAGGGLNWTLVARANSQPGTAEIWQAPAAAVLKDIEVTATLGIGSAPLTLTVVAFTGSAGVGASGIASAQTGPSTVALTTTRPGSLVFGGGND